MIAQLLAELQAVEKTAVTVRDTAVKAYNAAAKGNAKLEDLAALDPGRHQVALGEIRTAIAHVQTIMAAAEENAEARATQAATPAAAS
jgi:hypothetical protein